MNFRMTNFANERVTLNSIGYHCYLIPRHPSHLLPSTRRTTALLVRNVGVLCCRHQETSLVLPGCLEWVVGGRVGLVSRLEDAT